MIATSTYPRLRDPASIEVANPERLFSLPSAKVGAVQFEPAGDGGESSYQSGRHHLHDNQLAQPVAASDLIARYAMNESNSHLALLDSADASPEVSQPAAGAPDYLAEPATTPKVKAVTLSDFVAVEQIVYRAKPGKKGAKHVYGVDERGKKRHISHDAVLAWYGFEGRDVIETRAKRAAKLAALATKVSDTPAVTAVTDLSTGPEPDLQSAAEGVQPESLRPRRSLLWAARTLLGHLRVSRPTEQVATQDTKERKKAGKGWRTVVAAGLVATTLAGCTASPHGSAESGHSVAPSNSIFNADGSINCAHIDPDQWHSYSDCSDEWGAKLDAEKQAYERWEQQWLQKQAAQEEKARLAALPPTKVKLQDYKGSYKDSVWREVDQMIAKNKHLNHAQKEARVNRVTRMILKFNGVTLTQAEHLPVGATFSIPHAAQVLINYGYAGT